MATLEDQILSYSPVSFFKFDTYNVAQDLTFSLVSVDSAHLRGVDFEINQPSINPIDFSPTSIDIAPNQIWSENNINETSPAYLEIVNTGSFSFPDDGKFALETLILKSSGDRVRHTPTNIPANNNYGYSSSVTYNSPIFSKGLLFDVYFVDNGNGVSPDKLVVSLFNGDLYLEFNKSFPNELIHLVINYDIVQVSANQYTQTLDVWINGHKESVTNDIFGTSVPDTSSPESIFIGARGNRTDNLDELNTESLKINHISIYDRPLLDVEVVNLYSKTITQTELFSEDFPSMYYKMNDVSNSSVLSATSGTDGTIDNISAVSYLFINQKNETRGLFLSLGATLNLGSTFNPNYDFYLEFNIKTSDANGTILYSGDSTFPNYGLQIILENGKIRVQRSHTSLNLLSSIVISDGEFYNIGIRQENEVISLYIDNSLQETKTIALDSSASASRNIVIGGNLDSPSFFINEFAIYGNRVHPSIITPQTSFNYIFLNSLLPFPPEHRLQLRALSGKTYCVNVTVYNESQIASDNIEARVYDHFSGELQFRTNISNGELHFNPITNAPLDILFLDLNDNTVIPQILTNIFATEIS